MPARIVGFGVTSENGEDSGLKRQAMTHVVEWDSDFIYTDGHSGKDTCYGDSGGPTFVTLEGVEYLAGVTSFGTQECGVDMSGETRVDVYGDWVRQYVLQHDQVQLGSCAPDGQCAAGCSSPDPDCATPPGGGGGNGGSGQSGGGSGGTAVTPTGGSGGYAGGGIKPSTGGAGNHLKGNSSDDSGCNASHRRSQPSDWSWALVLFVAGLGYRRRRA
jgi:hypothetical protein